MNQTTLGQEQQVSHAAGERSDLARGYPIAVASAIILSTTAIFIRYLTQTYNMPALVLAFWRDSFVALTMLTVLAILHPRLLRVERRDVGYLVAYGLILTMFEHRQYEAVGNKVTHVASLHAQQARMQDGENSQHRECHERIPPEGQNERRHVVGLCEVADEDGRGRKDDGACHGNRIPTCKIRALAGSVGDLLFLAKRCLVHPIYRQCEELR